MSEGSAHTTTTSIGPPDGESDSLEARLERHTLMAAIATRFISVPADRIDAAVDDALAAIGRFTGVDRVSLAMFDDRYERWTIDHDWHAPGLWSLKGLVEHVAPFRWGLSQVIAGSPLEVLRPDYLPKPAANDALLMKGLGLSATLVLPVYRGSRVVGFATAATTAPRDTPWPAAIRELLELPARMMVHALARRDVERRLRDADARWQSLCDSNVVGVLSTSSRDGTIFESNDAGLRMLARTREELEAGKIAWDNTTPPEEWDNDVRMLGILQRTGRVMPWEKSALRPDGSRVPILTSLTSLAPQSEEMLSIAIDLSSRKRIAEELRRRNDIDSLHSELSRRLLELSGESLEEAVQEALGDVVERLGFDAVMVCDVDAEAEWATRRTWWSRPAAAPMEPELRVSLTRHPWWRERLRAGRTTYVADVDAMPDAARAERTAMQRFGFRSGISVPLMPGGTLRGLILFYSGKPMQVADDLLATLRVFGDIVSNALERLRIDRDITAAVDALERRVEMRRSQLEASNEELEAFAYSVSHDLRAPLRTVDGMCQVLREDFAAELGDDAVLLLRRIQGATHRMAHLIDGLLQLSRVVRTDMEWLDVSLSDLAEGVADEMRRRYAGRNVEVQVQPGIHLAGHARLLRIALEQLFDNAFKFTGLCADARIDLSADEDAGTIVVRMRDNGVGFDPGFAEKLFGAFQRLHGVDEFEGHGIGLATVERVVRMHGGSARAEGQPNRGATISLTFPRPTSADR